MLLRRLYDNKLAQASYLVGCQATGEAIVIDPARDAEQYVAAARSEGMRIAYVTETHIHADFVSGTRELAARTGAKPVLSAEGGSEWSYGWAAAAGARLVKDGDRLLIGNVLVEILHTPGHTPEHISLRITDTPATDRPMGVFTGDFVFVGDVGRPDLLEKAAGHAGTMESAAKTLFASLQRFKQLPDYLQIWPGHGAGSACGKALGAVPSSTLGYERIANWGLVAEREADFVREVLAGQPEPPPYFAIMKRVNRDGPEVLGKRGRPERLRAEEIAGAARGAVLVDTRRTADFAQGHLKGSVNVPSGGPTYAGAILPYDRPLVVIAAEPALDDVLRALASVGLDDIAGWASPDAVQGALETTPQVSPAEAQQRAKAGAVTVIDVRARGEWDMGHVPGARHVPLATLAARADELAHAGPLVLHCESGSRSSVATSLLLARGITSVANMSGGLNAWLQAGLPLEREAGDPAGVR